MTRAHDLYKRRTIEELLAKGEAVRADPANKNPQAGSIYLYTPKARKLLDDIAWAIKYHMDDKRAEADSSKGFWSEDTTTEQQLAQLATRSTTP